MHHILEAPSRKRRVEFLAAVSRSRDLHRGLVRHPVQAKPSSAILRDCEDRRTLDTGSVQAKTNWPVSSPSVRSFGVHSNLHTLGYYAFVPHNGHGRMSQGLRAVLGEVFRVHRLHRVEANIQPGNAASRELVRGLGFRQEGFSPRTSRLVVAGVIMSGGRSRSRTGANIPTLPNNPLEPARSTVLCDYVAARRDVAVRRCAAVPSQALQPRNGAAELSSRSHFWLVRKAYTMPFLFRTPVVIRRKQPYPIWANALDDTGPQLTAEFAETRDIYLGRHSISTPTLQQALDQMWDEIFEEGSSTRGRPTNSMLPKNRTRELFDAWFYAELCASRFDLVPDELRVTEDANRARRSGSSAEYMCVDAAQRSRLLDGPMAPIQLSIATGSSTARYACSCSQWHAIDSSLVWSRQWIRHRRMRAGTSFFERAACAASSRL